jgi:hypothetical protein
MKHSNHVLQSLAVTEFKTNIYYYTSVTKNSILVGYDTGSCRMAYSITLLHKFKTCTFMPVLSCSNIALEYVYNGCTAAVMDK